MLSGIDSAMNLARFCNGVLLQKTPSQIISQFGKGEARRDCPRRSVACYMPQEIAPPVPQENAHPSFLLSKTGAEERENAFWIWWIRRGNVAPSSGSAPALRSGRPPRCPLRERRPRQPSRHFFLPSVAPEAVLPSPLAPLFPAHVAGKDPSRRIPLRPQQ